MIGTYYLEDNSGIILNVSATLNETTGEIALDEQITFPEDGRFHAYFLSGEDYYDTCDACRLYTIGEPVNVSCCLNNNCVSKIN